MPVHIIQFQLPQEEEEYTSAVNGPKYRELLNDFVLWVKNGDEYIHKEDLLNKLKELAVEYEITTEMQKAHTL